MIPGDPHRSHSLRRVAVAWLVAAACLGAPGLADSASAAEYRVETWSIGRATHTPRPDRSVVPRRIYTQGVDAWAYDLTGQKTGSLAARFRGRFDNDFALPDELRDDPLFASEWTHFALDVGYLRWRPVSGLEFRGGRQWSRGTLGIRDHDGLRGRWETPLDPGAEGRLVAYAGREVESTRTRFDPDSYDVQGIPRRSRDQSYGAFRRAGSAWLAGGRAGVDFDDGTFEFAYRRRWRTAADDSSDAPLGSERFGTSMTASPAPRLTLSSHAIYHTQLDTVDDAALEAAWDLPDSPSTLSAGLEHRHPWFDSASIFNLFGTRPHQGAHVVYQLPVAGWPTTVDLRSWGRLYHGDPGPRTAGAPDPSAKARRIGLAAAHDSRLHPFGHSVDWSTDVSVESDLAGREGAHVLLDNRLRTPFVYDDLYVDGRILWLYADSGWNHESPELATTWVLGLDAPVGEYGRAGVSLEHTTGTIRRATTDLFATLELGFQG